MWYRFCRLIIAGKKEHIIKSVIDYFKEKGLGQVDLQSLQNNLNTLDENNLLPIIERRTNGVFFDGILYEDFLKFQEEVDGMYGEYKFRQKTNEQKVLQKNEPTEFVPGKISVFPINNDNDAIKYGVNTDWCISRPGSGMCENYRSTYDSTFYYVQDGTRKSDDPLSRVIVDMRKDGIVSLTDKNNTTGTVAKFGQDWKKYFLYLESKGVNTSQFKNKPLTQEEIEEKNLISEKIDELDKFNKLPFEYKFKYIGRGHLLTTEQLMSILNLQSVKSTYAKDTLINHYLNTGRCLPPIQKVILFENNEGLKKTYIRRREIEIDEIHEHYKDDDGEVDYDRLEEFADFYNDDEVRNKDNLYKDPLKFEDILVQNVEEFYFLLNKGVSLDQFNWIEISKMPNLPEDFIRKFKDEVYWLLIVQNQTLSEDFIEDSKEDFKDSYVWSQISLYQKLSEDFIRKFKDKVNWTFISRKQKLSENFIREFADYVDWGEISLYQKLSEDFIREFQDRMDWRLISTYQTLSEDFIKEFQDKVVWSSISERQKLSEDFLKKFQDKVVWFSLGTNNRISKEIKHSLKAQGFPIVFDYF